MWLKKFFKVLGCMAVIACLGTTAWASDGAVLLERLEHETPGSLETMELNGNVISRASGALNATIPANNTVATSESYYLDAGETVAFDCTYSPASASMDFGVIAPDGSFYYLNVTSGSIDKAIQVSARGYYTLAIRNNSSGAVTVTGTVRY